LPYNIYSACKMFALVFLSNMFHKHVASPVVFDVFHSVVPVRCRRWQDWIYYGIGLLWMKTETYVF
jgi:hypothetical protein